MDKKRVMGLDFIRFLAILFVPSVHYFLYNGFYSHLVFDNVSDILLLIFRNLFYICVPLFLLLTGYLSKNAKLNMDYFYKFFRIFISYLIISIIVLIFRILYLDLDISKSEILYGFLSFEINPYAWYVEMYLGLFLLIPFLNLIYNNITKIQKKVLIGILMFLTSLASITNNLMFHGVATNIFPDWWIDIYPITYFFIGKYLCDFPLKISKLKTLIISLLILFLHSLLIFVFCLHTNFDWGIFGGYNNLFTLILAVMIFSIFVNMNLKNKKLNKSITMISLVSFEMYLISYVFDNLYYTIIKVEYNGVLSYLINYFYYIPLVFISSFICAYVINKITVILYVKLKPIYDKIINIIKSSKLFKV